MPLEVVSWVGLWMDVLNEGGYRPREGAVLGWIWASHCNQWGICCVVLRTCVKRWSCRLGGEWGRLRHSCIRGGPGAPRGMGGVGRFV